ncbi:MAG: hypothetical protein PF486_04085, partial [Prolixibacteraceae bacterium]|nr:hypothetical protein [Prolixibacteraceae bacterium]
YGFNHRKMEANKNKNAIGMVHINRYLSILYIRSLLNLVRWLKPTASYASGAIHILRISCFSCFLLLNNSDTKQKAAM